MNGEKNSFWLTSLAVMGSAIFPGTGFLVMGKRWVGSILLTIWVGLLLVLGYFVITGEIKDLLVTVVSSTFWLSFLVIAFPIFVAVLLVLFWVQIWGVASNFLTSRWKKWLVTFLGMGITIGLVIPTIFSTSYLVKTKELMDRVFIDSSVSSLTHSSPQVILPADLWAGQGRVNLLIIGSDAGSDRVGVRADIIVVASIDTQKGDLTLFSLPRNLENVPFPDGSPLKGVFPYGFNDLINAVWTYAESRPDLYPGDDLRGLTATKEAVQGATGLDIDYSVVINMQGFQDFIDALGGVVIDVPRNLPIGVSGRPPVGYVTAGEDRLLNGWEALWFVRSRADSNDYDRMERTKCMIRTLTETVSADELVVAYPNIVDAIKDNFYTDIPRERLKQWVDLFVRVQDKGFIRAVAFTPELISPGNPDFGYIQDTVAANISPVVVVDEVIPGNNPVRLIEKIGDRKSDAPQVSIGNYC